MLGGSDVLNFFAAQTRRGWVAGSSPAMVKHIESSCALSSGVSGREAGPAMVKESVA